MELRGQIDPELPLLVVALHEEAEHLGTELPVLVTGVGKLAAAQSVLGAIAPLPRERRPRALVNLGTAGALRDGVEGTHVVGRVLQHDLDGASIEQIVGVDPGPPIELGVGMTLATGDRFVADSVSRDALASLAELVDMEGYAVASSARLLGIDVELVKHVSDTADEAALESWVDQVAKCSRALGSFLEGRQY